MQSQQTPPKHSSPVHEISPISSQTSSPDSQRRNSRQDSIASTMSGGSNYNTPQTHFLQKTKELREQQSATVATLNNSQPPPTSPGTTVFSPDKPPIPPRGNPPPVPQRQISLQSNENVQLRNRPGIYID